MINLTETCCVLFLDRAGSLLLPPLTPFMRLEWPDQELKMLAAAHRTPAYDCRSLLRSALLPTPRDCVGCRLADLIRHGFKADLT